MIQQRWINDHCESQTNPKNHKDHQGVNGQNSWYRNIPEGSASHRNLPIQRGEWTNIIIPFSYPPGQICLILLGKHHHSPHKFRHRHVHYGLSHAKTIEDYKVISINVMHSSMEITDHFYSVLNDNQVKERISSLIPVTRSSIIENKDELFKEFEAYLEWKTKRDN